MSVLFTTVYSGIELNSDLTKSVVDRFRSLPGWRPAPLLGALLGDCARYLVAGSVIILLGLLSEVSRLGWRFERRLQSRAAEVLRDSYEDIP